MPHDPSYLGGALSGALAGAAGGAVMPPPAGGDCVTELGGLCGAELGGESTAFCSPGLQALNAKGDESVARMSEIELKEECFMCVGPLCGDKLMRNRLSTAKRHDQSALIFK